MDLVDVEPLAGAIAADLDELIEQVARRLDDARQTASRRRAVTRRPGSDDRGGHQGLRTRMPSGPASRGRPADRTTWARTTPTRLVEKWPGPWQKVPGAGQWASELGALRWHFLGAVQRNKVPALAPLVHCWQSLAREVEEQTAIAKRRPRGAEVLVEVALTDDPTRNGCPPGQVGPLVASLAVRWDLAVGGLMAVAPAGCLAQAGSPSGRCGDWRTTWSWPSGRWG